MSASESLLRDRLEEVVERPRFERADRIFVVRRDEDDQRRAVEQLQHFEPVELRHLDVEQQDVGIVLGDGLDRFESVGALRHELDIRLRAEVLANQLARERLVVDHDRADRLVPLIRPLPSAASLPS